MKNITRKVLGSLKEILEDCNTLTLYEKRSVTDEYVEIVISGKELPKWEAIFKSVLGPAVKPAGAKPSDEVLMLTEDYGGIYPEQTLYSRNFDGITAIAMIWPWKEGDEVTIKMAFLKQ